MKPIWIKQYFVCFEKSASEINDAVKEAIEEDGWQPFGSMSMVAIGDKIFFAQPMIQYDPDDENAP